MRKYRTFVAILLFIGLMACEKRDTGPEGMIGPGTFIVNEGGYNGNNGSISFISDDGGVVQNLFLSTNERPLGDVVQSMHISGQNAYIVVNNSQKTEVVDLNSFESITTILGTDYPRYFTTAGETGYLTDGNFAGSLYLVDLNTYSITDKITVGSGPENLIVSGDQLFIANSGGWSNDSTISIVNLTTGSLEETIIVGHNPTDLIADRNGSIWILCKGEVIWNNDWSAVLEESPSKLCRFDPADKATTFFEIGEMGDFFNPFRLAIDGAGEFLYFNEADGVYAMNISANGPPASPLIEREVYGLDVDPVNGLIYALVSTGVETNGWVYRYNPDGTLVDSLEVGIMPNAAVFNTSGR